jgi:ABC-type nitrate/sulfonate/bicarbonate transport system substrate-binding protein
MSLKALLGLLLTICLVSLGLPPAYAAEETVHFGVQPTMSPVYIAIALGLLAPIEQKDGVRFLFQQFQDGSAENQAIRERPLEMFSEDAASCIVAASRFSATLVAIDVQGSGGGNAECVSDAFLARRPDVVQDVMNALVRASDFIVENPRAAAKLWAKQINGSEDVIIGSLTRHVATFSRDIVPSKTRVDPYVNMLRRTKVLGHKDGPKVDPAFARKALAQPSL